MRLIALLMKKTLALTSCYKIYLTMDIILGTKIIQKRLDLSATSQYWYVKKHNKLLVRFLGDAWCPDVVEEWVKRIEHDKNNDVDYVIDTYMFGVIENDQERKSSDFHVSFYYRG